MMLCGQAWHHTATELELNCNDAYQKLLELLRNCVCVWHELPSFQKEYKYRMTQGMPQGELCLKILPVCSAGILHSSRSGVLEACGVFQALAEVMSTEENVTVTALRGLRSIPHQV